VQVSTSELRGLWRRSLLQLADGSRDTATAVHWLQGEGAFVDLRQPPGLPVCAAARALDDLSFEDCLALAAQQGFAGRLQPAADAFEWIRTIDYQPASPHADAGSLAFEGGLLVERGRDIDYLEHWHREPSDPIAPFAACALRARHSGVAALLLRVGPHFMWARGRAAPLAPGGSLRDRVAGAVDIAAARALIDCEISYGRVNAGVFAIAASTLPHRIGARLAPPGGDWEVLDSEGDLSALP
jgi:hypothetical protein